MLSLESLAKGEDCVQIFLTCHQAVITVVPTCGAKIMIIDFKSTPYN